MAIAAHLDESANGAGKERAHRRKLRLEVAGALASGVETNVMVHNVSATGLLLESRCELAVGDRIEISLPYAGGTWARIIWSSGHLFGCQFDRSLSQAALSATLLRSAVDQPVEISEGGQARMADTPFGIRLHRLRKQRGLTLAQVADRLGVSKPTVWAWEQGKARPVSGRLEALAEILAVAPADLVADAPASALGALLDRVREQIARAVGSPPDKIRIMIDL